MFRVQGCCVLSTRFALSSCWATSSAVFRLTGTLRSLTTQQTPSVEHKQEEQRTIPKTFNARVYNNKTYNCVYDFRYINHLRIFSRAKLYQTIACVSLGVASPILYELKYIDSLELLLTIEGAMVFALAMMFIISRLVVQVVGKMYLSECKQSVLISHLNFFGKRRDVCVNVSDVAPLESIDQLAEKFVKFKLMNADGHMLLSIPLGRVYNKKDLLKIFQIDSK